MTRGASGSLVRDSPIGVIKRRARPIRRCVAGRTGAGSGETGPRMIGNRSAKSCGALPVSGVTTVTIRRRHGGTRMAQVAGHRRVRPSQSKTRRAVVEGRSQPTGSGVARRAGRWVTQRNVIGHRAAKSSRALKIGGVATVTIGRQRSGVVAIHVAQCARYGRVRARQRESCGAVIECRAGPIGRRVADRAIGREARGDVIGNGAAKRRGAVPVRQMASVARGRIERIVVGHMAGNAGRRRRRDVHPRQSETSCPVIPRCRRETHRRVTGGTICRGEGGSNGGVRRCICLLPVR